MQKWGVKNNQNNLIMPDLISIIKQLYFCGGWGVLNNKWKFLLLVECHIAVGTNKKYFRCFHNLFLRHWQSHLVQGEFFECEKKK